MPSKSVSLCSRFLSQRPRSYSSPLNQQLGRAAAEGGPKRAVGLGGAIILRARRGARKGIRRRPFLDGQRRRQRRRQAAFGQKSQAGSAGCSCCCWGSLWRAWRRRRSNRDDDLQLWLRGRRRSCCSGDGGGSHSSLWRSSSSCRGDEQPFRRPASSCHRGEPLRRPSHRDLQLWRRRCCCCSCGGRLRLWRSRRSGGGGGGRRRRRRSRRRNRNRPRRRRDDPLQGEGQASHPGPRQEVGGPRGRGTDRAGPQ